MAQANQPGDAHVLRLVHEAFSACARPEHFTNYRHCCECAEHDALLLSRDNETLCLEDVGNAGWDPLCYVDAAGFAYFFPGLARLALDAYVWADSNRPMFVEIVGPNKRWGGDNSDAFYYYAPVDPSRTYRVRGHKGDAVYLSLTVYGGPRDGRFSDRIVGTINDRDMQVDRDGAFEIVLSPTEQRGNWLKLDPDAVCAITRDYVADPARGRKAIWTIEATEPAPPPRHTDGDMARRFRAAATFIKDQLSFTPVALPPANTVLDPFPVPEVTRGWAAGDAAYAMGSFELEGDQALVISGRSPECTFWNMCL